MIVRMIFSGLDLARRLERAEALAGSRFVEARNHISPEIGACWIEAAGIRAIFDGPSSPATQTFGLGLFADLTPSDLDRIEAFFRERRASVTHEVSPLAGVPVADLLSRRGYHPVEFSSIMYKPIDEHFMPREPNPRLTIRLAGPGEEELYSETSLRGWAMPEFAEFLRNLGRAIAQCEGALSFFALLDGQPVATAVLRCDDGVAFMAGASTVPEARRLGAQRALFDARLQLARERGCDIAIMGAEPGSSSQRNAEREGFRVAYTRTKWQMA
ncbi:MAG TPA: GNAT family N-acetyltransferase [Bryobacteraceae bacterium]|jgi:GNAT superfamily N-acetyltransferase|nr:GNAT family N-acetyltransferase [Bryobacteraceae bacterium]